MGIILDPKMSEGTVALLIRNLYLLAVGIQLTHNATRTRRKGEALINHLTPVLETRFMAIRHSYDAAAALSE